MVPKLAETASKVTVFMRNNTYIAPPFGSNVSNKEADPDALDPAAAGKHHYTEKEKQRFREDPEYHLKYRTTIERQIANGGWDMFNRGSELNLFVKGAMQDSMKQRLAHRDDLKERIIPTWSPGCRRLTPGDGYLEALIRDNVECEFDDITKVTETGLETITGKLHEVDILACATGFNVQYFPHFMIKGVGGQVMQDSPEPNVYASIAAPGYPNYFVINGPRSVIALATASLMNANTVQGQLGSRMCFAFTRGPNGVYPAMLSKDARRSDQMYGTQAEHYDAIESLHGCVAHQSTYD